MKDEVLNETLYIRLQKLDSTTNYDREWYNDGPEVINRPTYLDGTGNRKLLKFKQYHVITIDTKTYNEYKEKLQTNWDETIKTAILDELYGRDKIRRLSRPEQFNEVFFCVIQEGEEITKLTKKEKELIKKRKEREDNRKLVKTFGQGVIEEVCKKYGLYNYSSISLRFNNIASLKTFITKCIEETIIKELKERGVNAEIQMNKRGRSMYCGDTLIKLKSIDLDNNEVTE